MSLMILKENRNNAIMNEASLMKMILCALIIWFPFAGLADTPEVTVQYTKTPEPADSARNAHGGFSQVCPGHGGWDLLYESDGDRSWLEVRKAGVVSTLYTETMEAAQGIFPSKANDLVEWRGVMRGTTFVPHAIIYRMQATDPQTDKEKTRLVVVALAGGAPRVLGSFGGANESEESRALADRVIK